MRQVTNTYEFKYSDVVKYTMLIQWIDICNCHMVPCQHGNTWKTRNFVQVFILREVENPVRHQATTWPVYWVNTLKYPDRRVLTQDGVQAGKLSDLAIPTGVFLRVPDVVDLIETLLEYTMTIGYTIKLK